MQYKQRNTLITLSKAESGEIQQDVHRFFCVCVWECVLRSTRDPDRMWLL